MGGNTYDWSGRSDGYHSQGVAAAVSNKLTTMIIEVTPVTERIMRGRICHSLGVICLVSVYALTEASDLPMKDAFYVVLDSAVDQCPRRDSVLVLGDFNASTGTDRDGYEMCVGPHGSGTMNQNSTKFLDFARSHGLGWLVHDFCGHRLIAGLGISMLVVWQRRLTMCSLMVTGR